MIRGKPVVLRSNAWCQERPVLTGAHRPAGEQPTLLVGSPPASARVMPTEGRQTEVVRWTWTSVRPTVEPWSSLQELAWPGNYSEAPLRGRSPGREAAGTLPNSRSEASVVMWAANWSSLLERGLWAAVAAVCWHGLVCLMTWAQPGWTPADALRPSSALRWTASHATIPVDPHDRSQVGGEPTRHRTARVFGAVHLAKEEVVRGLQAVEWQPAPAD